MKAQTKALRTYSPYPSVPAYMHAQVGDQRHNDASLGSPSVYVSSNMPVNPGHEGGDSPHMLLDMTARYCQAALTMP
jgi:hypothetical protein